MKAIKEFFLDVLHEALYYLVIYPMYFFITVYYKWFPKKTVYHFTEKDVPKLANIKEKESYTLYIGRESEKRNIPRSKWCNPFGINKICDRPTALLKHEKYFRKNKQLMNSLHELAGHTLGCYCYSSKKNKGKLCHGHTLIKIFKEKFNIQ